MKKITAMLLVCTMLLSFPCLAQSAPLYHGAPLWIDFDDPVFSTSADVFCKHDHTEICQEHHCDKTVHRPTLFMKPAPTVTSLSGWMSPC